MKNILQDTDTPSNSYRLPPKSTKLAGLYLILAVPSLALITNSASADLVSVNIFNNIVYTQTSVFAPTVPTGYFFNIGGEFQSLDDFDTAIAEYPGPSSPVNLPVSGTVFGLGSPSYSTLQDLRSEYPFGIYSITASNTNFGVSRTGNIDYTEDYFTPNVPALTESSFNSLQGFAPDNNLVVFFNAFTPNPGVNAGHTFFSIMDLNHQEIFNSGSLSNTSTSVLIPANTLSANSQYIFELDFTDRLNGYDSVNQVNTIQGFDVRTNGVFTTGNSSIVPLPTGVWLFGSAIAALGWLGNRSGRK